MEPDKRQNDDSFPGSMDMPGPETACTAYRAQAGRSSKSHIPLAFSMTVCGRIC
jgi:hypothetical protein